MCTRLGVKCIRPLYNIRKFILLLQHLAHLSQFHHCAQVLPLLDLCHAINSTSAALPFPSLSSLFCAGVAAAPAHTACQDGGAVAENLRSPVQCCEDNAV